MRAVILGAASFLGKNLAIKLGENTDVELVLVDKALSFFDDVKHRLSSSVKYIISEFDEGTDYLDFIKEGDLVFHLFSSTVPTTSNTHIQDEIRCNIVSTVKLLDACVQKKISRIIFFSSGGTVYGKDHSCPLDEETPLLPINSYGWQKMSIEKLMYVYHHTHRLDYKVVRLSNPYGPYQRHTGVQGVITNFLYRVLNDKDIEVYGDGSIVRDYIYVDDAIDAILKISFNESKYDVYNIGSGVGITVNDVINLIFKVTGKKSNILYEESRNVDVPINYLGITRFENEFGKIIKTSPEEGIKKLMDFWEN